MVRTEDRMAAMKRIQDEIFSLTTLPLYKERVKNNALPVVGEGSLSSKIMFVGEAPGKNEAKTGKPFCGASGRILDELLGSISLPREDVYITSIVKDRPPKNRDPLPEEIVTYGPFLDRQIEIIKPKVIATLGRYSMNYIMKKFELDLEIEPVSKAHGKMYKANATYGEIKIIPLYHPAVAIYNNKTKDTLKKDFEILRRFI